MPRNKLRLQVALYARPKHPDSYHYALFISPKDFARESTSTKTTTTKHHVKNTLQVDEITGAATTPWRYEKAVLTHGVDSEPRLLVRILIAKLSMSREQVEEILQSVPIYQVDDDHESKDTCNDDRKEPPKKLFNCVTWVRDACEALQTQGAIAGRKLEGWDEIERKSVAYVNQKRAQSRWDGSWKGGIRGVPLMDLNGGKEIVE